MLLYETYVNMRLYILIKNSTIILCQALVKTFYRLAYLIAVTANKKTYSNLSYMNDLLIKKNYMNEIHLNYAIFIN